MKSIRQTSPFLPPFRLAFIAAVAMTASSDAALLLSESFSDGYTAASLADQNATGLGLTGAWTGSGTGIDLQYQSSGLSMAGVHSAGGSIIQATPTGNVNGRTLSATFASAIPNGQLYGSYLFSTTTHSDARSLAGVFVGPAASNDGTTAAGQGGFTWASNSYNTSGQEGPGVRAGGSGWQNPGVALTGNQTYLMLFEFSGNTTTAWVLNEAQLTNYLTLGSLDASSLNAAVELGLGTGDNQVVWSGSATATNGIGALTDLKLVGIARNNNTISVWDELRVSSSSLYEAVTAVPEPSSFLALGLAPGMFALRRRRHA